MPLDVLQNAPRTIQLLAGLFNAPLREGGASDVVVVLGPDARQRDRFP